MSPIERAQIEAKAEQAEMTLSEFLRASALESEIKVVQGRKLEFEVEHQISRIGVNMNQIAKRLNEGGSVPPAELQEASAQLKQIFDVVLADIYENW